MAYTLPDFSHFEQNLEEIFGAGCLPKLCGKISTKMIPENRAREQHTDKAMWWTFEKVKYFDALKQGPEIQWGKKCLAFYPGIYVLLFLIYAHLAKL